jgi:sarcosine oxidase subunit gamma
MLEHRAALDQLARDGDAGAIDAPGLRVAAVTDRGLLLVQGDPDHRVLHEAVAEGIGLALPGPLAASLGNGYALLWMTPKEWLLELPAAQAHGVQAALAARLGPALAAATAAVTDVSDAFAAFDVSGDRAADVLMTACSLDLTPGAFAAGRAARTLVADVPAVIFRPAPAPGLRCLVDRSFAAHLRRWLAQAGQG